MCSMKRFGLAALFVVGVALVAGTSAPAMGQNIPLVPAGEPNASGKVQVKYYPNKHYFEAKVVCQGLTPGGTL